jgi:inner membrane protein
MIAPTHIGLGLCIGEICGLSGWSYYACVLGSIIPDVDTTRSFAGRIFSFISIPLSRVTSHRNFIHSLILWTPFTILFAFLGLDFLFWTCIAAIAHLLIDCLNTNGVRLFAPFSSRVCVLVARRFRFPTASRAEYILCFCLYTSAFMFSWMNNQGGFSQTLGRLLGSYDMAIQSYKSNADSIGHFSGYLRYPNGETIKEKFLIIGTEGQTGVAIWDHHQGKVLHLPEDAEFQYVWYEKSDKRWNKTRVDFFTKLTIKNGRAFMLDSIGDITRWRGVESGESVRGWINYEKGIIEFSKAESFLDL